MRRGGFAGVLAVAAVLVFASVAHAGSPGQTKKLGKAGGLSYLTAPFPEVASLAGAPVNCGNRFAVGGGATIAGKDGGSELYSSAPFAPLNGDMSAEGWTGQAVSSGGEDQRTWAFCAKSPIPFANMGSSIPLGPSTVTVSCLTGHVLSGGIQNDASNLVDLLGSGPVDGPDADLKSNDAWSFQVMNQSAAASNPAFTVACSPDAKTFNAEGVKNVSDATVGKVLAKCPKGYVVTGMGFFTDDAPAMLTGLEPWDSKDKGKTPEDGARIWLYNSGPEVAFYTATAVCSKF
jgi:hypothetical protein